MFSAVLEREIIILATFTMSSANAFNLDQSKILPFGKEPSLYQTTKNLDLSKLKALADDKINVTQ